MMNTYVKDMMKKAGLSPYYPAQENDLEKFAALIVTDIVDILRKTDWEYDCPGAGNMIAELAAEDISKLYGVKS